MQPNTDPVYLASQGLSPNFHIRFMERVSKTESCWIWTGQRMIREVCPYGKIRMNYGPGSIDKNIAAHRASWILFRGPIPDELRVLHCCPGKHNSLCVNPDHLYLGTQIQNIHDALEQGTMKRPPILMGELTEQAKLCDDAVRDIRKHCVGAYGELTYFAKKYGVSVGTIWDVKAGKSWKHVQ